MQPRNIFLGAAGVAVLGGLLFLVFQVKGERSPEVSEEELARARAAHARMLSAQTRAPAPVPAAQPPAAPRPRPADSREAGAVAPTRDERPELPERSGRRTSERRRPFIPPSIAPPTIELDRARGPSSLDGRMDQANNSYDRGDYEAAIEAALEVLRDSPDNRRMLRVVVSAACITGDEQRAREHYAKLAPRDQNQMSRRCERYGMTF